MSFELMIQGCVENAKRVFWTVLIVGGFIGLVVGLFFLKSYRWGGCL